MDYDYSNKGDVISAISSARTPEEIKEIMEKTSDEVKNDPDLYLQLERKGLHIYAYRYMGEKLKNDEKFILEMVDERIPWASEELKKNKDFMKKALRRAIRPRCVVSNASSQLKSDKSFILDALANDDEGYLVLDADIEIQKDPDIQAVVLTKYEPEQTLQYIKNNIAEIEEQAQRKKTPLQQRDDELSSLEAEKQTIAEEEALIDKQAEKEGQDIGEE